MNGSFKRYHALLQVGDRVEVSRTSGTVLGNGVIYEKGEKDFAVDFDESNKAHPKWRTRGIKTYNRQMGGYRFKKIT